MEKKQVVVVGAGIIGLTTAYHLLEKGYRHVQILSAEMSPKTTSDGAGAIFGPAIMPAGCNEHEIIEWSKATWNWLVEFQSRFPDEEDQFLKITSGTELHENPREIPYWSDVMDNFQVLSREEIQTRGYDQYASVFTYSSLMILPTKLMQLLQKSIEQQGGTFHQATLTSLDTIEADIIVNCAGLHGGKLSGDPTQYPTRGQTVKVFQPLVKNFTIVTYADDSTSYILPRPNGIVVLGGTKTNNDWNQESDPVDVERIYSKCCQVEPKLKQPKICGTWAGLRPQREQGPRVEKSKKMTSMGALLVHNYGHGGSGHTLHRGCALAVGHLI